MIRPFILASALLPACLLGAPGPNPNLPLDRPFTQRNASPGLLEGDYRRQIAGDGPMGFLYPRPCASDLDSSRACGDGFRVAWRDTASGQSLSLAAVGAGEYRYVGDNVWASEAGFLVSGHKHIASFDLDARVFNETVEGRNWVSYDGDAVDYQDAEVTGSATYLSFARYRGALALDLPFGRLEAGRDAAHWGPALMGNLVFHSGAVPFNQYVFTTHLGPVSVRSLHGDIRTTGAGGNRVENSLYAHRYEWRATENLLLGISEQLILSGADKPYLFAPIFPLFIAKSFQREDDNNGNLSADIAWRLPGAAMVYGEFLLDDLESPTSLLTREYAQNKWAALAGAHASFAIGSAKGGAIFEATRVEPWVYTHFRDYPAQAANAHLPLGNPLGPNTLDLRARAYLGGAETGWVTGLLPNRAWYAGLTVAATWKGTGPGSTVDDTTYGPGDNLMPKEFLQGADGPEWSAEPFVSAGWKGIQCQAAWKWSRRPAGYLRLMAAY